MNRYFDLAIIRVSGSGSGIDGFAITLKIWRVAFTCGISWDTDK